MTDEPIESVAPPPPEAPPEDPMVSVHEAIDRVANQARAAADAANAQAADIYDRLIETTKDVASKVEPFVQEQTYLSLGLAAAAGLILGLLLAPRGPKVLYLRPRD